MINNSEQQVAIVTGANHGIGFECCNVFTLVDTPPLMTNIKGLT